MADNLSLFSSRLKLCRFDDSTLRILELVLSSSKDVNLSIDIRSRLIELLRQASLTAIREAAGKSIELKLLFVDFFVRAFAIVDDLQSCLALRYEGLVMRDSSVVSHPQFRVSCYEWMKFAEDAFDNAYYSAVAKACENALLCVDGEGDSRHDNLSKSTRIDKIQMLKDVAIRLSSSHSVQAHTAEYVRKKILILKQSSSSKEAECPASISFKNGIKLQNARNLMRLKNQ